MSVNKQWSDLILDCSQRMYSMYFPTHIKIFHCLSQAAKVFD